MWLCGLERGASAVQLLGLRVRIPQGELNFSLVLSGRGL
jgi:hypothetical protein